jgi:hypothetical protein
VLPLLAAAVGLIAVACDDEPGTVTEIGGAADGAADRAAVSTDPVPAGDPVPGGAESGALVGTLSGYEQTVETILTEWAVIAPRRLSAGRTRFLTRNDGHDVHELVLLRGTTEEGDELMEIEGIAPSTAREAVYDLEPGTYLFACLIREIEPNGRIEDHFALGMRLEVIVE